MILGILSDTHDSAEMMAAGLALLKSRGANFFIHCGDVCLPHLLDLFTGLQAGFVWGNNETDHAGLRQRAEKLGIACWGDFGEIELNGKRIAVLHGHDFDLLRDLIAQQRHDYVLSGHTHVIADQRAGRIRLINPGALRRAREKTVALLDLQTDQLEFLTVTAALRQPEAI